MFEKILTALKSLDPSKDEHWTSDGAPRIDVIKQLTGEMSITRDNIVAVAPSFNRTNAIPPTADNAAGAAQGAPATTVAAPTASTAPGAPPAPKTALPPPPTPEKGDLVALAKAEEALQDAEAAVTEIDKYIESATAERKLRLARRDSALNNRDRLQPIQTSGDAIQAYLTQQRANLALRGEQIARVTAFQKEHGFKLADLMPKRAPLDVAMARKNNRGAGRPGAK